MDYLDKFEILVKTLAENALKDEFKEDIKILEAKLKASEYKGPYFGIARDDWDNIEVSIKHRNISGKKTDVYYAEYYDGFQAPFFICEWNDAFEKLEDLLNKNSKELYKQYQKRLAEYCLS